MTTGTRFLKQASSIGVAAALLLLPATSASGASTEADEFEDASKSSPLTEEESVPVEPESAEPDPEDPGPGESPVPPEEQPEEAPDEDTGARVAVMPTPGTHRIAGVDRYETAALISRHTYPEGADTVIIANGATFADSLSATPLAARINAPLLLVQRNRIPTTTQAEIRRLAPSKVVIVGGPGVVSPSVATGAGQLSDEMLRLSGPDRYATSLAITQFGWPDGADAAFIATGSTFADALSAGSAAAKNGVPIVLVPKRPSPTADAVREQLSRLGINTLYVMGGEGAVAPSVVSSVSGGVSTVRYGGADRYETAATLLSNQFADSTPAAYFASGQNFPDALAGAAAAGAVGVPLTLSRPSCIPLQIRDSVDAMDPSARVVLGGTGILGANVEANEACFLRVSTPSVSGKLSVGSTLTAVAAPWSPTPSSLSYQWYRNGSAISGATGTTYKLVRADSGKSLSVTITGALPRFAITSVSSKQTAMVTDPTSINTASSLNVVVNKKRPLSPANYTPPNLRIPAGIGNPNGQPLRAEAATALETMSAAAKRAGFSLYVMSAYRSYSYQSSLYSMYVNNFGRAWADSYSARPGYSEHQTGLAADIYDYGSCEGSCFGNSRAGLWLRNNSHKYGFILRYDQGMRHIVGYEYEPWHFRYVGAAVSEDMHKRGIASLEQYYGLPAAPNY